MDSQSLGRRKFLGQVAVGSAVGATIAAQSQLAFAGSGRLAAAEDFEPHVGSMFRVRASSEAALHVELVEVVKLPTCEDRPRDLPRTQPFILVFAASQADKLPQETFEVEHRSIGRMPMLLCARGHNRLEATFN